MGPRASPSWEPGRSGRPRSPGGPRRDVPVARRRVLAGVRPEGSGYVPGAIAPPGHRRVPARGRRTPPRREDPGGRRPDPGPVPPRRILRRTSRSPRSPSRWGGSRSWSPVQSPRGRCEGSATASVDRLFGSTDTLPRAPSEKMNRAHVTARLVRHRRFPALTRLRGRPPAGAGTDPTCARSPSGTSRTSPVPRGSDELPQLVRLLSARTAPGLN